MKSLNILLVDDDLQALESTRRILEFSHFSVTEAQDGQRALELIKTHGSNYDLILSDVRMPKLGGLELLRALAHCQEKIPVILMTAFGRVQDAVWAMKLGAIDFLMKPFKRQELLTALETALKYSQARQTKKNESELLIGNSKPLQELRNQMEQVAPTSATVLITGESGTGKELVSKCIHALSPRTHGNFIAINCAALPESLMESELFGYQKGAFTGATQAKQGLFEAADGGTLLLDEIGDMPLVLQAKLLRVLEDQEVRRLGENQSKKVDVRVLAATHQNLGESVKAGKFRQDLLYRLEVVTLKIPPLRERIEDLPVLSEHFLKEACSRHEKKMTQIADEALKILMAYSWPGNVRELSNIIERAVVFCRGEKVTPEELPPHLSQLLRLQLMEEDSMISVRLGTPLREVEELLIRKTLEATSGDKNKTAKLLGIHSRTIHRRVGR